MPVILFAPGTVEPLANVAVKPRVDGQIIEVAFKEGDFVEAEQRAVPARRSHGQGADRPGRGDHRRATRPPCATPRRRCARRQSLIANRVVTEAALDQARFAVEGLKASITAGQALARLAEDAARLPHHPRADQRPHRQPDGQARRDGAQPGRAARSSPSIRPSRSWSASRCRRASSPRCGARCSPRSTAEVKVPGGSKPTVVQGVIAFVDNQVDRTTGTIGAKVHGRERRRGAVARPVGRGGADRRGQAARCCRCRRRPCCRRSRA